MKLALAVFGLVSLLQGGKASAADLNPVDVSIHCACEDDTGRSYLKAVLDEMSQHPEYRIVGDTASGEVLRVEITSRAVVAADGTRQSSITVVSRHADVIATDTFQRSCNWIGMSDAAQATVAGLQDLL